MRPAVRLVDVCVLHDMVAMLWSTNNYVILNRHYGGPEGTPALQRRLHQEGEPIRRVHSEKLQLNLKLNLIPNRDTIFSYKWDLRLQRSCLGDRVWIYGNQLHSALLVKSYRSEVIVGGD